MGVGVDKTPNNDVLGVKWILEAYIMIGHCYSALINTAILAVIAAALATIKKRLHYPGIDY